eukprot:scaffold50475_cov66-Phaeocystis_antarctica.AAC.10
MRLLSPLQPPLPRPASPRLGLCLAVAVPQSNTSKRLEPAHEQVLTDTFSSVGRESPAALTRCAPWDSAANTSARANPNPKLTRPAARGVALVFAAPAGRGADGFADGLTDAEGMPPCSSRVAHEAAILSNPCCLARGCSGWSSPSAAVRPTRRVASSRAAAACAVRPAGVQVGLLPCGCPRAAARRGAHVAAKNSVEARVDAARLVRGDGAHALHVDLVAQAGALGAEEAPRARLHKVWKPREPQEAAAAARSARSRQPSAADSRAPVATSSTPRSCTRGRARPLTRGALAAPCRPPPAASSRTRRRRGASAEVAELLGDGSRGGEEARRGRQHAVSRHPQLGLQLRAEAQAFGVHVHVVVLSNIVEPQQGRGAEQ